MTRKLPKAVVKLLEKAGNDRIAQKATVLDIHDDGLVSVRILASRTKKNDSEIQFKLRDDGTGRTKTLTFVGCANLRFAMDFDVMSANWFAQTSGFTCTNEAASMAKFAQSQQKLWGTRYMPPSHPDAPIRKKLSNIRKYHLFTIKFFGGKVDILARTFRLDSK